MAGFFGLFDYSKPGKGVDKGAPEKKRFFVFFDIFLRKFWKLIQANLLFLLFSIPLVTSGLANGGLTIITRNYVREDHAFLWGDFIDGIKKNWKQLLVSSIANTLITVVLLFNIWTSYISSGNGIIWYVFLALNTSMFIIFSFMKYYIPHMIVTFKFTLKQIYKNAAIFAFANLLNNVLLSVILILFWAALAVVFLTFNPIAIIVVTFAVIFIAFAFTNFLTNFIIYPKIKKLIIDPYYETHPDEEKPFHLTVHDEPEYEDELVFEDKGRNEDFDN